MVDIYHNGEMYTPKKELEQLQKKVKEVLKQAVLVCEYRAGDVCTEDGSFATTDTDSIIRLEEALCDALDSPYDHIRMLDVMQNIDKEN
ncbi:MAG: hypothetical protein E2O80_06265 [Betaproteobacteria bacterium]|nr:MAG: hypothetical protein E2O80_06265 [Betaproteobacteria bacterium]